MADPPSSDLQSMLQMAVQKVQWMYSLFWQQCPQQGILIWGDGYYNGVIKTRKTVQPLMEVSAEEATLGRSQQLKELYDMLSAGEANQQPAKRPSAALSPEDLTEAEWFYLMCISFSFPPGSGLPGKAFAKREHIWLTGATESDSKFFSRAILAKSARVQTVVCIPLLDGVVELGTTEKVEENLEFVETIQNFFVNHKPCPSRPALSEQSTSNQTILPFTDPHITSPTLIINNHTEEDEDEDDEADDQLDYESETGHNDNDNDILSPVETRNENMVRSLRSGANNDQATELMQLDMSEDIRVGSPDLDDGSNNLGTDFRMMQAAKSTHRWLDTHDDPNYNNLHPPSSALSPGLEELIEEENHYYQTIATVLQHQTNNWSSITTADNICSSQTAFTKWPPSHTFSLNTDRVDSSQFILKRILSNIPLHHAKPSIPALGPHDTSTVDSTPDPTPSCFRKLTPQEELSASHVLAERRRREKLNKRFIILRSLIPFVTKMDKASILGDAIEYVKQLRKKIQDLDTRIHHLETDLSTSRNVGAVSTKRKIRILEGDSGGGGGKLKAVSAQPQPREEVVQVEVSIIENDALIELQCPHKDGLLLDLMQILRQLRVETTVVQSTLNNGIFVAELRAKVKESVNGKRASITEVKRAMHQIIPRY